MNRVLLVTRPNHDCTTNYLYYWADWVIQEARKKHFKVLDLKQEKANRRLFISYLSKNSPKLIFLNGHGSSDTLAGHNNESLINVGDSFLSNKIVYARSCCTASRLGVKCVDSGAQVYIGYKKNFAFFYTTSKITRPLEDDLAKLFLEPSNLVPISLMKGNTAGMSYKKSQKAMYRNIRYMLSSNASVEERNAIPYLIRNLRCQTLIGDPNARL